MQRRPTDAFSSFSYLILQKIDITNNIGEIGNSMNKKNIKMKIEWFQKTGF